MDLHFGALFCFKFKHPGSFELVLNEMSVNALYIICFSRLVDSMFILNSYYSCQIPKLSFELAPYHTDRICWDFLDQCVFSNAS